jgi:hypothetical protein
MIPPKNKAHSRLLGTVRKHVVVVGGGINPPGITKGAEMDYNTNICSSQEK